jgi:hypothetical protein
MTKKMLKLFVPLFALMFVMGALVSGAGAATSGAAGFSIVAAPNATKVDGDSVNYVIQVLDRNGAINTLSNGQVGDVLFSVTTSIGTEVYPYGNVGSSVNGGLGEGEFDAVSEVNLQPKAGLVFGYVYYSGTAGKDTIAVRMYESIITGANETVAGAQRGPAQIFEVDVAGPTAGGSITAITNVQIIDPVDSDDNFVEILSDKEMTVRVDVANSASGTVTLQFVGINESVAGNNASGTTVTKDVDVTNGFGFGTVTFTKAGKYEIRASAGDASYVKYGPKQAPTAQQLIGTAYALIVDPGVPTQLVLALDKAVIASDAGTGGTVTLKDANGNVAPAGANVEVVLSATNASQLDLSGAQPTILAGDASAALPGDIVLAAMPSPPATCVVTASAPDTGLSASAGVTLYVRTDYILTATLAAGTVYGVGQQLIITEITDNEGLAEAGQGVTLKLGPFTLRSQLESLASGLAASFTLPTKALGEVPAFLNAVSGEVATYPLGLITVQALDPSEVMLVNPNGFDLAGFSAGGGLGPFNIPSTQGSNGAHFKMVDQYGNNVPVASNINGTVSADNLAEITTPFIALGTNANENAQLTWENTFSGTATVTLTPIGTSGIPAITFDVSTIGTTVEGKLDTITVTPAETETLSNSLIPVVIETLDQNGKRIGANVIISVEQDTAVTVLRDYAGYGDESGLNYISGGRDVFALDTGNAAGDVTLKVQSTDGKIVTEVALLVATNGEQPPGFATPIGQTPGEVDVTADENVELFVPERASDAVAEYFAFAGVVSGFSTPVYVLSSTRGVVPVDQFDPLADRYAYQADNSTGLILAMGSLNLKAGDQFLYAYVYIDPQGEIVVGDPVIVNIVAP